MLGCGVQLAVVGRPLNFATAIAACTCYLGAPHSLCSVECDAETHWRTHCYGPGSTVREPGPAERAAAVSRSSTWRPGIADIRRPACHRLICLALVFMGSLIYDLNDWFLNQLLTVV